MNPLMQLGAKRSLTEKDVWKLDTWDRTETLNSKFQQCWAEESRRPKPWLLRALHRSLGGRFWWGGFWKMTTAISIEDVRREVKILKALAGHKHLVRFYDACEDTNNVYIVMELCEGGELLDKILSRGGRYTEEDAKVIVLQILSVVALCHLQGVVHCVLKPENFLFTTRNEDADMKLIDFGLSDFIRPGNSCKPLSACS